MITYEVLSGDGYYKSGCTQKFHHPEEVASYIKILIDNGENPSIRSKLNNASHASLIYQNNVLCHYGTSTDKATRPLEEAFIDKGIQFNIRTIEI